MSIESEVAVLKNDLTHITILFEKLDTAIDKMSDVSNNIARMLAVHEERLNKQDLTNEEIHTLVERRKQELQGDIKELHSRITTVSRELADDINETEQRLTSVMHQGLSDIKRCITDETKIITEQSTELEKRVSDLERWKWLVMGGSIVVGAFAHEVIGVFFKNP